MLLVGDAAGYVDALTGEGVALALAGRRTGALRAHRPPAGYEQAWRRVSRRHRLLTGTLLWARHRPRLASGIVPAAASLPGVFKALINQLA